MSNIFQSRKELKVGKIIEVSGNNLRIEIDEGVNELIRAVDGQVYPVGQMGSIIKVHFGRKLLFAFVRSLKMRSELITEDINKLINAADDARILEVDLFGQGVWSNKNNRLEFSRGVETYPLPLQSAYICLNDELEAVYNAAESNAQDEAITPMVPIGNYIGGNNAVCRANIDKLFGHHFAILGSTGSGKSGTVASILHSVLDHRPGDTTLKPKIVMIDPHGEYASAFGNRAKVFRAYNDASAAEDDAELLKLPYWLMSSDELRSLIIGKTEHEATSQNNIVYEAITYSRLLEAGYVQDVGAEPNGGLEAAFADGVNEDQVLNFDRDKPVPFKLTQFVKHIDKVQG
ncbi:ATP-binding protein, partial [Serratia marcescens]